MKRVILFVLAALILVSIALVGYQLLYDPGSDQVGAPVKSSADQIARGAYLARVGDCVACHTMRGGKPFSGGRAIATPYGKIYSPNITPDAETGIGAWNADDFWRALHNGKSRNGEFLYPAFPFTDYTKVTRTDSDALFAYFKSLEAVHQSNRQQELRFPYNQRPLLAAWRSLYFRPGSYSEEKNQSTEWNRGAYLVQGLGHCNACHTGRAAFGSSDTNSD
ncbi:MAG TPA: cytochrome c, partial [Burkholderiaceae bacterium]|nr:cytochrome c [Burkholderiaceae bacterium]